MDLGANATALLEAIAEPALVLDQNDRVVAVNRRGQILLGPEMAGHLIHDLHASPLDEARCYLNRCRGSKDGLPGVLIMGRAERREKHRCRGARVQIEGATGVLLTVGRGDEERFVALSQKIHELNAEIRERRHAEAVLAEALRERDLLMRELQHRVKNNMHMLAALLQSAEREAASPEAKAVLRDSSQRFAAVSAVHQLVYNVTGSDSVDGAELVAAVARAAVALVPRKIELIMESQPFLIPIDPAISVALIVNELVTNSAKYGHTAEGSQQLYVSWTRGETGMQLVVEDNGPGFVLSEGGRRSSGLGLVRGLLRQLGGSFAVEPGTMDSSRGVRCVAQLPIRQAFAAEGTRA